MMQFLETLLKEQNPEAIQGKNDSFTWQYMAEGVLCLTPDQGYEKTVIISAGIHGNETAPIELLDHICTDLFEQTLSLKIRVLFILGNPLAIRSGKRYQTYDMNRMFCGAYAQIESGVETQRASTLETLVTEFFEQSIATTQRYHFDLHTAIRASLLPTFAMLPYQTHPYSQDLLELLSCADLDAVVYHNAIGKTFTHFTSEKFLAASATLELGQAKPFGENDLSQFAAIDAVLRAVISQSALPTRTKKPIRSFKVTTSILKVDDDFQLNLSADAPNFSVFHQGDVIASQASQTYTAWQKEQRILFPNPHVAKGLRAGLILEEV